MTLNDHFTLNCALMRGCRENFAFGL